MVPYQALNSQIKDPQRIKKSDKAFIQNLDYTGIKNNLLKSTSMYLVMKKNNHTLFTYQKKSMEIVWIYY